MPVHITGYSNQVGQKVNLNTVSDGMFVAGQEVKPVFMDEKVTESAEDGTTINEVRPRLRYAISGKLFGRYTGPHKVYEVINPVVYVAIVDEALYTVCANKLK